MGEPLSAGAVQVTVREALPGATVGLPGASGGRPALLVVEGDQGLSPLALPARTCTWYDVPLVNVVMVAVVVVLVLAAFHSVHVLPLSDEYRTS